MQKSIDVIDEASIVLNLKNIDDSMISLMFLQFIFSVEWHVLKTSQAEIFQNERRPRV